MVSPPPCALMPRTLHLSECSLFREIQAAAPSVERLAPVKCMQLSGKTFLALQTEKGTGWGHPCPKSGFLPIRLLDNCPVLPVWRPETEKDASVEAWWPNTSCFSAKFGKCPRLSICLGITACTSEKEAFKGDSEKGHSYLWREGDISSLFQGQVFALSNSAPLHCGCWWMCEVRREPLSTGALLGELVPPPVSS